MENEHGQLMQAIGELKGLITGITQRLDSQNGRIGKLEGKVDLIEKQQATADGRLTAFGWVGGTGIALMGIIIAYLQYLKK